MNAFCGALLVATASDTRSEALRRSDDGFLTCDEQTLKRLFITCHVSSEE